MPAARVSPLPTYRSRRAEMTDHSDTLAPTARLTETAPEPAAAAAPAVIEIVGDPAIRPFQFRATDEQLADLRRRIAATIFPERETVPDASQGVQLATMEKLARYWA